MIQQVLLNYQLPMLSAVGLGIFMVVFVGWCLWVFRKDSHKIYKEVSNFPLGDE